MRSLPDQIRPGRQRPKHLHIRDETGARDYRWCGQNLTPNALRLLDHLSALSVIKEKQYGQSIDAVEVFDLYGGKLAESAFRGPNGNGIGKPPYKVRRLSL